MAGALNSGLGRANRSTSNRSLPLVVPPSTLTKAFPRSLPRLASHLTEVPTNLNVAVAPATVDCTALPLLHPACGSLGPHPALKLTAALSSSKRPTTEGGGVGLPPPGGGVGLPPSGGGV